MKALVLAGGFGTRLRPLTYTRPKHLLPIANRSHIEHVFDWLRRHRVTDVVLLTSYLSDAFDDAAREASARGLDLAVAHEREPLGTAGALKNAEGTVGSETFIALNGDVLTDADLDALLELHRRRGAEATMLLTPVDDPSRYGVATIAANGLVEGFVEKPPRERAPTNLVSAGVYVFEPRVLSRIPSGEVWSAERQLFPQLVEERTLFALATDAYWIDIGTRDSLLQANMDALQGRFPVPSYAAVRDGGVLADDSSVIERGARLSSVCVGAGATVAAGAVIERSVLLPGVRVEDETVVRSCALGENVIVRAGARIENETIGDGDVVE